MGKSRYVTTEPNRPHFFSYTVKEWPPVFGGSLGRERWSVPGCIPTLERGNDKTHATLERGNDVLMRAN